MSKEGPQHPLLLHADKIVCEFCNGTTFQVKLSSVENTTLPTTTKAYLWENSPPHGTVDANMQTVTLLCQCGQVMGKLLWCFDTCSARDANMITGTAIKAAVANGLVGLWITLLGGTDIGDTYQITANTLADPTVMTIVGTPHLDTIGELILLSSFEQF